MSSDNEGPEENEDTRTEWQKRMGVGERLNNIATVKGGAKEFGRRNPGR